MVSTENPRPTSLFKARAGFELVRGKSWITPILMHADWPLGGVRITPDSVFVSAWLFVTWMEAEIPWSNVTSARGTWTGLSIEYLEAGEHYELILYAPFLWRRFQPHIPIEVRNRVDV